MVENSTHPAVERGLKKIWVMTKRWFDIVCSVIALIVFGPLMVLIAVLVRLDSPGDPIFRQLRVGYHGRVFQMLKFRTMRIGVEPYGVSPHVGSDPRLTRLGRYLREKSLDELPQLFNVLGGTMSLVGPRPLYERQAAKWNDHQRRRLEVSPGITGYAQVFGRGAITHEDKIDLDVYYVEHWSFVLDLKILVKTVLSILGGHADIYEQRYSKDRQRETDGSERSAGSAKH